MNETDPWGIAPGFLGEKRNYCSTENIVTIFQILYVRGFCEYSGQNILFANKDTFLDKQGSYLLMNIIVL